MHPIKPDFRIYAGGIDSDPEPKPVFIEGRIRIWIRADPTRTVKKIHRYRSGLIRFTFNFFHQSRYKSKHIWVVMTVIQQNIYLLYLTYWKCAETSVWKVITRISIRIRVDLVLTLYCKKFGSISDLQKTDPHPTVKKKTVSGSNPRKAPGWPDLSPWCYLEPHLRWHLPAHRSR